MADLGETPQGFLKHSQEFFDAAHLVLKNAEHVSLPAYFLLGLSIELSLKAFLLHRGMPIAQLRKKELGHNLRALLEASRKHGIREYVSLDSFEDGVISLLSYDYAEKRLEYRRTGGTYSLPAAASTWDVARKLAFEIGREWDNAE